MKLDNKTAEAIPTIISKILSHDFGGALLLLNGLDIESQPLEIKAKLYSWKGQSLLGTRNPHQASISFSQAIRCAKSLGHQDDIIQLKEQRDLANAQSIALDNVSNRDNEGPIAIALTHHKSDPKLALTLLETHFKNARLESNHREMVLSLLAISTFSDDREYQLNQALIIAQTANEPNLITAVKRTLDLYGIQSPKRIF
jgi:hypothetical protein